MLAQRAGLQRVACEFDIEPPNPASARFHERFGFREAGQQAVPGTGKRVSLQIAKVSRQNAASTVGAGSNSPDGPAR